MKTAPGGGQRRFTHSVQSTSSRQHALQTLHTQFEKFEVAFVTLDAQTQGCACVAGGNGEYVVADE